MTQIPNHKPLKLNDTTFQLTLGSGINLLARLLIFRLFQGAWISFQTKGLNYFGKNAVFWLQYEPLTNWPASPAFARPSC